MSRLFQEDQAAAVSKMAGKHAFPANEMYKKPEAESKKQHGVWDPKRTKICRALAGWSSLSSVTRTTMSSTVHTLTQVKACFNIISTGDQHYIP